MFTTKNTINELMANPSVKAHLDYMIPMEFVEIVPEHMRDLPIFELESKVKMPWGVPYFSKEIVKIANDILDIVSSDKYSFIQLWANETAPDFFGATDGKREHVALLKFKDSFKKGNKMALVVPGGAYMNVAISNEGIITAEELVKAGYAVCVLNYRCTPNYYPIPQLDLTLAIKCMRVLAQEYDLADDLLVVGYSAGGHLTASQACYHQEYDKLLMDALSKEFPNLYERYNGISSRPDKVCLSYAVINFLEEQHEESFISLSGGDESLRDRLSIDLHVTKDYPKAFVWACDDDALVPPSNSSRMAKALENAGVDVMYKTYPTGGHGCATGVGTSAEGWITEMVDFMK